MAGWEWWEGEKGIGRVEGGGGYGVAGMGWW